MVAAPIDPSSNAIDTILANRSRCLRRNSAHAPPNISARLDGIGHRVELAGASSALYAAVCTVIVLVAVPVPGVTVTGLKLAVAPAGSPVAVSVTGLL